MRWKQVLESASALAGIFIDQCAVSSLSLITNVGKWKRLRKQTSTLNNMMFPAPKLMWQRHIYFCESKNKNNDICRCLSFGADGGNRTRDSFKTLLFCSFCYSQKFCFWASFSAPQKFASLGIFGCPFLWSSHNVKKQRDNTHCFNLGADGGNRTRDLHLTKVVLYH